MGTHLSKDNNQYHNMKCMVVVLAVASLCLAEPEADPLHYYAPYGYAHGYAYGHGYHARPHFASGYATPLAGGYAAVHRLHKREAEADPQVVVAAGAAPYVNDGPVSGPLTPAVGDLVATPKGYRSLALEGFSEDLNEDGFVDPIAPAAPVVVAAAPAPVVAAAPAVAAPAPLTVAAPAVTALNALPAAAPIFNPAFNTVARFAPAPLAAPFAAPFATPFAAPVAAVAHAPVVKSVVEAPAVVNTEVHAAPLFHHAPVFAAPGPVAPVVPRTHVIKPFVQF